MLKSEIITVRENLATRETDVGESTKPDLAISDSFTSALAITSNLFAVILSGTMIMSAHKLARQARNITTVARNFELDVPLREHLVDRKVTSDDGLTSNDDNPIQASAAGQSERRVVQINNHGTGSGTHQQFHHYNKSQPPKRESNRMSEIPSERYPVADHHYETSANSNVESS